MIKFLASFLIWLMFAGLAVLWFIDGKIKKEQVIHAVFSVLSAWIIGEIIKILFPTTRPYMIDGILPFGITPPGGSSFPSGHTAGVFALATSIWLHNRRVGWIYLISAFLVGVGRVLANVHYPVDIFGGAILGIFTAFIFEKIHFKKFLRK